MLEYVRLRLTFEAATDLQLTAFKGSTIRSLLKTSLRNLCCVFGRNEECESCSHAGTCPYAFIMDHKTEMGEDTVLPICIACASIGQEAFRKGNHLSFDLVLFGKAIIYLPYVVACLCNWERLDAGMFQMLISEDEMRGRTAPRFWSPDIRPGGKLSFIRAEQVTASCLRPIYEPGGVFAQPVIETLSIPETQFGGQWVVRVRFLSPVRIFRKMADPATGRKKKTMVIPELFDFDIFFRALRKRFVEMARHFGEGILEVGEEQNEQTWQAVRVVETVKEPEGLRMMKIRRYNRNLGNFKHYDGLMGEVEFRNVSDALIPWIMAGELLQAGKFPAMGYGEYQASYHAA